MYFVAKRHRLADLPDVACQNSSRQDIEYKQI